MDFEQVGVEAIVEGLSKFGSDIGSMNSLVSGFVDNASRGSGGVNLLGGAMDLLGKAASTLISPFQRVAEIAFGILVRDTFRAIARGVQELIGTFIEAGIEFQNISIQMESLFARDLLKAGTFDTLLDALPQATEMTQDLLDWVQQLSVTTPLDTKSIAKVIALAKAYGMTTGMAQDTTSAITDFVAGMGLGDAEMRRIIENFGQMIQQGKITGTELRDLGRGAFVPVNDLLERTRISLGLTEEEFAKMKKAGELPAESVNVFIQSFIDLVNEEMPGAAQRASNTVQGVISNIKDLTENLVGLNIMKPLFDLLSTKANDFLNALLSEDRFARLNQLAGQISFLINDIVGELLNGVPSAESFADLTIGAIERFRNWLATNKDDIVASIQAFFTKFGEFKDWIITNWPIVQEKFGELLVKITEFKDWVETNWPIVKQKFEEVSTFVMEVLIPAITQISQWVKDNKEEIIKFIVIVAELWASWQIVTTITALIFKLIGIFLFLIAIFASGAGTVIALMAAISALIVVLFNLGSQAATAANQLIQVLFYRIQQIPWHDLGKAIMQGLANGIRAGAGGVLGAAVDAARNAYNAIQNFFKMGSPSKLFRDDVGFNLMAGWAKGITENMDLPVDAMNKAMVATTPVATTAPVTQTINRSNVTNTTNNFAMNVNGGNGNRGSLINDFRTLEAIASEG